MIRHTTTSPTTSGPRQRAQAVLALCLIAMLTATDMLRRRWNQITARADEGSETVAKAVLVAIALGLAVALGAAITAVVKKYQAQIK